MRYNGNRIT